MTNAESTSQLQPTTMPNMVYVVDFALDSGDIKQNQGPLDNVGPLRGGVLRRDGVLKRRHDPETTAGKLVGLLSDSLVNELTSRSVPAVRVSAEQPLPKSGWVVRGQFMEVDEGNRIRRAVVGFGSGATNMEVDVNVCNLASFPSTPFLMFGTEAGSGKMPGAVVTMNPYVAAAKFVMSKKASDKDVKHTASEIAAEIVRYMEARGLKQQNP